MSIRHRMAFDHEDHDLVGIIQYAEKNNLRIGDPRRYVARQTSTIELGSSVVAITHCLLGKRMIRAMDISEVSALLDDIQEEASGHQEIRSLFGFIVAGYEDDPRPLCDMPEVRAWFADLHAKHPYASFLLHPFDIMSYVGMLTPIEIQGDGFRPEPKAAADFLRSAFAAGNRLCLRLARNPANADAMISQANARLDSAMRS